MFTTQHLKQTIISIKWLGDPIPEDKPHGNLIPNFTTKQLASKFETGGLTLKHNLLQPTKYIHRPKQCFKVLKVGRLANTCKNHPFCSECGDLHNTHECDLDDPRIICFRNVSQHKYIKPSINIFDNSYSHSAFISKFPTKCEEILKIKNQFTNV